jgi:hypothetical protein
MDDILEDPGGLARPPGVCAVDAEAGFPALLLRPHREAGDESPVLEVTEAWGQRPAAQGRKDGAHSCLLLDGRGQVDDGMMQHAPLGEGARQGPEAGGVHGLQVPHGREGRSLAAC